MCYHEQLLFLCGCKSRSIFPCPHRIHLERCSTVNWRRVHKLTRICPKLEWDQIHIDINCEPCQLEQQDIKPFTEEWEEHAEMHQRMLGTKPAYITLLEPTWSWRSGRLFNRRDQVLRKRIVTTRGVHLVRSEDKLRMDELRQWQAQATKVDYGELNVGKVANAGVQFQPRPQMPYKAAPQQTYASRYQYNNAPGHVPQDGFQGVAGTQKLTRTSWQWRRLPIPQRTFTAPAMPAYNNPFAATNWATTHHPAPGSWTRPRVPVFRLPMVSKASHNLEQQRRYDIGAHAYVNNTSGACERARTPQRPQMMGGSYRQVVDNAGTLGYGTGLKRHMNEQVHESVSKRPRNDSASQFAWLKDGERYAGPW